MSNNSNLWMLPHAAGTSRPIKILLQNKTARQTKSLNALWKALSSYIKFNMSSTAAKPQGFSLCWNFNWSTRDVKSKREKEEGLRPKQTDRVGCESWRPSPGLVIYERHIRHFRLTIYFTILRSNLLCPWAILHAHCRGQPNTESLYIPFISIWYCSMLATTIKYICRFQMGSVWLKTYHLSNITTKTIKNQYWHFFFLQTSAFN